MIDTSWTNPPKIEDLELDIRDASDSFLHRIERVDSWLRQRAAELKIKVPKGRSRMSPKLIRKQYEWRYPKLADPFLSDDDMFKVSPRTAADVSAAQANELILNKQFSADIERQKFVDELVQTVTDEGSAFVFVGWDFQQHEVTRIRPIIKRTPKWSNPDEQQQLLAQLEAGNIQESDMYNEELLDEREVTSIETTINKPKLEVVEYDKIMVDPNCKGDLSKAKFVVHRPMVSISDLMKDGRYENLKELLAQIRLDQLNTDYDNGLYVEPEEFNFADAARKRFRLTQYYGEWDVHGDGKTTPIIIEWVGKTIVRMEENPYPDQRPPFVLISFMLDRSSPYGGEPDAELIGDNQDIVGAITRGIIDTLAKSANGQTGTAKGALDPIEKIKMQRGDDFEYNPTMDPRTAFHQFQFPDISNSTMNMINWQQMEAESITGTKAFSQGISGNSLGESATGVRSVMDATAQRDLAIIRRIADGLVEIARKITAMNAVNLTDNEVVKITDNKFITIRRDELAGDFDLKIDISTPEMRTAAAEDLKMLLQTMPNADLSFTKIIWEEIAKLKRRPALALAIANYEPQPNPAQEEISKLQIELLKAQIANEQGKANENNAQSVLHEAKAEAEKAKAGNISSNTDILDLKFLKERYGVDHKNNMESAKLAHEQALEKEQTKFELDLGKLGAAHMVDVNNHQREEGDGDYDEDDINVGGGSQLQNMDTPTENVKDYLRK